MIDLEKLGLEFEVQSFGLEFKIYIINRPGVARDFLKPPLLLID